MYLIIPKTKIAATVTPLYVAYVKPTGIMDIAFASPYIVILIKAIDNRVGVNFENPSEILAKLFAVIPVDIAKSKNIYPVNGFTYFGIGVAPVSKLMILPSLYL